MHSKQAQIAFWWLLNQAGSTTCYQTNICGKSVQHVWSQLMEQLAS